MTAKYIEAQVMSIARPDVLEIPKAKFSDESNTLAKQSSRSDRAMTVSLKVVTEAPVQHLGVHSYRVEELLHTAETLGIP